jgi:catechol 2,3-dioxygenase-like lactoylglutathione lyase family enzyme
MLDDAAFICPIPVTDLERALGFYQGTLGFAPVDRSEAGILLELPGGGRLLLYESPGGTRPTHTLAAWEVPALEPVIAALKERGVAFEDYDFPTLRTQDHIAWIGPERAAWFRDPDGNVLSISEPWVRRDAPG